MFRRSLASPFLAALLLPTSLLQARPVDVSPFRRSSVRAVSRTKIKSGRGRRYRFAHLGANEASTRRIKRALAAGV